MESASKFYYPILGEPYGCRRERERGKSNKDVEERESAVISTKECLQTEISTDKMFGFYM